MTLSTVGVPGWTRTVALSCRGVRRAGDISSWTKEALAPALLLGMGCDWQGALGAVLGDPVRREEDDVASAVGERCFEERPAQSKATVPVFRPAARPAPERISLPEASCDAVKPILARFESPETAAPRVRQETPSRGHEAKPKREFPMAPRVRRPSAASADAEMWKQQSLETCQQAASGRVAAALMDRAEPAGAARTETAAPPEPMVREIEKAFERRVDGPRVRRDVLEAAIAKAAGSRLDDPRTARPARTESFRPPTGEEIETAAHARPVSVAAPETVEEERPLHPIGVATRGTSPSPDMQINAATDVAGSVTRISPPLGMPSPPPLVSGKITTPPALGLVAPMTRLATRPEDVETEDEDLHALAGQIQEILRREARRHGMNL